MKKYANISNVRFHFLPIIWIKYTDKCQEGISYGSIGYNTQAAIDAIEYAFENLRSPNWLLYWDLAYCYDAGAGINRNPAPTADGQKFIYGHVWVTLSAIARHKNFGTIGLPLLAKLYVKAADIKNVGLAFKSKTEQAVELSKWAYNCCKSLEKQLWIVTDGGFTRASF